MVAEGSFREDLLYRINTIHIEIPPLRDRKDDILAISEYFLKKYCAKYRKACLKINSTAISKLLNYKWPGNVRELQHTIEKAVILSDKKVLTPDDFFFKSVLPGMNEVFDGTIEEMEQKMIAKVLKTSRSNLSAAAYQLGITRQTLYNKMKKYNF
jgi:transcriptional regulator with PAS, ATPase and Fis domain